VDRKRKQVLLRLTPSELRALDALAAQWGTTRSEAVARLVDKEKAP
jgi:hypothetical protein